MEIQQHIMGYLVQVLYMPTKKFDIISVWENDYTYNYIMQNQVKA